MGKGDQDCSSLGRDVGRARSAALTAPALLLVWQLVGYLVNDDELEHLTQAPVVLGVRKTDGVQAGLLIEAHQPAGRSRSCSSSGGGSGHPALGRPCSPLPPRPTQPDQALGPCDQARDAAMGNGDGPQFSLMTHF